MVNISSFCASESQISLQLPLHTRILSDAADRQLYFMICQAYSDEHCALITRVMATSIKPHDVITNLMTSVQRDLFAAYNDVNARPTSNDHNRKRTTQRCNRSPYRRVEELSMVTSS